VSTSRWLPRWLDGPALVQELNAALIDLTRRHGALVADVHDRFIGHGVAAGDPATADVRPADRDLWSCGVIEPTPGALTTSAPAGGRHLPTTAGVPTARIG
jgi:hypothetical protein